MMVIRKKLLLFILATSTSRANEVNRLCSLFTEFRLWSRPRHNSKALEFYIRIDD